MRNNHGYKLKNRNLSIYLEKHIKRERGEREGGRKRYL